MLVGTELTAGSPASFCGPPVKADPSGKKGTQEISSSRQNPTMSSWDADDATVGCDLVSARRLFTRPVVASR